MITAQSFLRDPLRGLNYLFRGTTYGIEKKSTTFPFLQSVKQSAAAKNLNYIVPLPDKEVKKQYDTLAVYQGKKLVGWLVYSKQKELFGLAEENGNHQQIAEKLLYYFLALTKSLLPQTLLETMGVQDQPSLLKKLENRFYNHKRKKRQTLSQRSHLILPVGRILRYLRQQLPHLRISNDAAVYLTAVIQYLLTELLDVSGMHIPPNKVRIQPRHIALAILNDLDFLEYTKNVTIPSGGVWIDLPLHKEKKNG